MKASLVALAASSLLGGAAATAHARHAHFHAKKAADHLALLERGADAANATCDCEVKTTTIYGEMTLCPQPPPAPTPIVSTWSAPGTYTIVKSTVTLTETTTVASPTVVTLTPGPGTYGGVTTTVTTPGPVTCPVATVSGSGKATTSVVVTSTHTCTEVGVCVIGGTSTSVSVSTISVYPVPATYEPGTYTIPDTTVTVTETGTVYVCPFSSVAPSPVAAPTTKAPAAPPAESSPVSPVETSPAAPHEAPPAPYQAPAKPAKPAAPAPKKHHGTGFIGGNKPGSNGGIPTNGNKWAMAYTPYTHSGSCKSAGEVMSDIGQIAGKGFTTVRLYATDCSGLENVGNACKAHGLKMLAGVFIDSKGLGAAQAQVSEIVAWGQWDLVEMVVCGNEAIFNDYCSAPELAAFIVTAKAQLKAAGYTGPVTATEPLETLQHSAAALCPVIDVVAANIQPFFNNKINAAGAGKFVAGQLKLTGDVCPGKEAYNLECGWPSSGSANGLATPGPSQQQEAIAGVLDSDAASRTVVFSFQNDGWKSPGEWGVEQFFGVANILEGLL